MWRSAKRAEFEQQVRERFITSQLPSSLMSSSITTKSELQEFVSLQDQTRDFRAVLVPPVEIEDAIPPGGSGSAPYPRTRW